MKNRQTNILIVGAGTAGIAAAIAAARQGMKVILVEKNAYAGGKATAAEVGTICGLYHFNKQREASYLVAGFAVEFAEELRSISGTEPLCNAYGLQYLPYQIPAFKRLCHQLLQEHGVEWLFDAELIHVSVENNAVAFVELICQNELLRITANAYVDCTGHSQVSHLAGLPLIQSEQYQAAAQVFTINGLDTDLLSEQTLGLILAKALRMAVLENRLQPEYERLYLVPGSCKHGMVSLKLGIPLAITYSADNMKRVSACGKEMVENICNFLFREVEILQSASLHHIAPEAGIRVGFRSTGKYILQEADVLGIRKFDDAIAVSSWPVEEWILDKRVQMKFLPVNEHYQIPAGCLISNSVDNLFFAGRNISASDAAIASARVMGTCLQTGYAAGVLAAFYALGLPENSAISLVQEEQILSLQHAAVEPS